MLLLIKFILVIYYNKCIYYHVSTCMDSLPSASHPPGYEKDAAFLGRTHDIEVVKKAAEEEVKIKSLSDQILVLEGDRITLPAILGWVKRFAFSTFNQEKLAHLHEDLKEAQKELQRYAKELPVDAEHIKRFLVIVQQRAKLDTGAASDSPIFHSLVHVALRSDAHPELYPLQMEYSGQNCYQYVKFRADCCLALLDQTVKTGRMNDRLIGEKEKKEMERLSQHRINIRN